MEKARKLRPDLAAFLIALSACAAQAAVTVPSGIIPPACQGLGVNLILPCYLNDPSDDNIASAIDWHFHDTQGVLFWYQWPATAKEELNQAFINIVEWHNGGMTNYAGPLAPDPPPDPIQAQYNQGLTVFPALVANDAWHIYIEHVALTLAEEIYQWVPWGLHNYDTNGEAMEALLLASLVITWNDTGTIAYSLTQDATPGNAIDIYKFLLTNNLIGTTKIDTIGRVLDWARTNLWHFGGSVTPQNFFYNWQYSGYPPVSRVIAGTPDLDPQDPELASPPHHWTAGCFGTSAFLVWVLRAVNIPVEEVSVGGHTAPWFVSEDLFLSHGDDPYNAISKAGYPATYLLVSRDDFEAWFPSNNLTIANQNVGRRPVDLAVNYPTSNWVLFRYCDDLQNNRDHASGRVYNETFSPLYTVLDLEELGLWDNLAQAYSTLGCPALSY